MPCTRPQLITELSRVDGRREVTLETISRRLCASGLVATNGSHGAPAMMNWADAANLLIGSSASLNAAEAPEAVVRFRALQPWGLPNPGSESALPGEVYEAETFGMALEALIAAAPLIEDSFLDFTRQAYPERLASYHADIAFGALAVVTLEVDFLRGCYEAGVIRVVTTHLAERQVAGEITFRPVARVTSPDDQADRTVTTRIGLKTIRALYAAISVPPLGAAAAPAPPRGKGASGDAPSSAPSGAS